MMIHPVSFIRLTVVLALICLANQNAESQFQAPVEQRGFTSLTSYAELQEFLQRIDTVPGISVQHIACTKNSRNVSLVAISAIPPSGPDTGKVRVLLFAQQHGDEPSGKEAMTMLLARAAAGKIQRVLEKVDLLIVPQMNPDGSELRQRRTAEDVDLNRNHVLLTAPETKGLHDAFYRWLPHITVDIHEYSSFDSTWREAGFIKTADVQLGMLTNLNTSLAVFNLQHHEVFPFIEEKMKARGYSFHEYIVGTPQEYIRHSTTEVNDGRQSLGILGTVSFIQEGRKWRTLEDQLERRATSQLTGVEALLEYCAGHASQIKYIVAEVRKSLQSPRGRSVAVRMDHVPTTEQLLIPVQMVKEGCDTTWEVHPYRGQVRLQKTITLPEKYLIQHKDSTIVELLLRHHITIDTVQIDTALPASSYRIRSVEHAVIEGDTLPLMVAAAESLVVSLKPGDYVVPTSQLQSVLLGILLEPESQWGLTKYDDFGYLQSPGSYPIRRVP
jgi:hypothetical protein